MKTTLLSITTLAVISCLPLVASAQEKKEAEKSSAAASGTEAKEKKPDTAPFRGKISSVDPDAKTISLEGAEPRVLALTDSTKLLKGGAAASMSDLVAGEEVRGQFRKAADGKLEAVTVKIGPRTEEETKKAEERKAKRAAAKEAKE